jgi:hypothetical protein
MQLRIALGSAFLVLVALLVYGLARPLPVVPLIVPIGSHASPEEFARSQVPPHLSLRVLVKRVRQQRYRDPGRAVRLPTYVGRQREPHDNCSDVRREPGRRQDLKDSRMRPALSRARAA